MANQQKLISVNFEQIKNLKDMTINFGEKRVMGIFGPNGCGKSTLLYSILCLYRPEDRGNTVNYTFGRFFKTDEHIDWRGSKIVAKYESLDDETHKTVVEERTYHKKSSHWIRTYKNRPQRSVYFVSIETCVPDIEIETTVNTTIKTKKEAGELENKEKILKDASFIMNRQFVDLYVSKGSRKKYYTLKMADGTTYKSLNMGAGEQRILKILRMLYSAPKYSLVVIDELELGIHTDALLKLLSRIVSVADDKKLQVIFSSHKEELVDLDIIDKRHIVKIGDRIVCMENTTNDCIKSLTGQNPKDIFIYVEDDLQKAIVRRFVQEHRLSSRTAVSTFGAASNAFVLASGLFLANELTDKTFIFLDGDVLRTEDEKMSSIKDYFTGSEPDHLHKCQEILKHVGQFEPEYNGIYCTPEKYFWEVFRNSESMDEFVAEVRSINFERDPHDYINRAFANLGYEKPYPYEKVAEIFHSLQQEWEKYFRELREKFIQADIIVNP